VIGRPLLTRAESKAADRSLVDAGVPGIVLMENAGRAATDLAMLRFPGALGRVVVVGGVGQNGGDAWVLARHLLTRGVRAEVFLVGDPARVAGDAASALAGLRAVGMTPTVIASTGETAAIESLRGATTLVVDGLFGTGLDRPLEGLAHDVVRGLGAWSVPRVALDVPSGVCADTGRVLGAALRADLTVTFHAAKRGLHHAPGLDLAGEVIVADIGVPPPQTARARLVGEEELAACARRRANDSHKGTAGHALIVAGSPGKTGAALLAGLGAIRAGAGLVTLAARGAARAALDAKVVELMTREVPEALEAGVAAVLSDAARASSAVLGPGLGLDAGTRSFVRRLAVELPVPTVIDADGLRALDESSLASLAKAAAPRVLTPHPAEAGALLGLGTAEVQADRFACAERLAELTKQIIVLKGARTVVAARGELRVCDRGTPALGVAGTGDVLSGVISALLGAARAEDEGAAFASAWQGVVAHALAGERAAAGRDRGLLAGEVAEAVSFVLAASLTRRR
jgi:ADP-dependent NAD(P)H-hydrate dehydratase / NAD(P)H-hydrate epimerase